MEPEAHWMVARELAAAAVVLLSAYGIGAVLLAPFADVRASLSERERRLFAFGLGSAALAMAIFALGLAGLIYDATFAALAAVAGAAWWKWGRAARGGAELPPMRGGWTWRAAWYAALAVYGVLYLINALAPEVGSDALGYHLGFVARYYREHRIPAIVTSVYAFLSQGAEMLFLYAYAMARHDGPKLVHLAFLFATAEGIVVFARRWGCGRAGYLAALLFFVSPVVGNDATQAYNDVLGAFYQLLLFHGLVVWARERTAGWLAVLGGLAGFGFAIKFTAVYPAAAAAAAIGWIAGRDNPRRVAPALAVFALAAAPFAAPWPVKNWVVAGNPVAPFYNRLFPNPYVTLDWEDNYRAYLLHYKTPDQRRGWRDYLERPLEAAWYGQRLGGFTGPVFLAAPLGLLAWGRPLAGPLAAAAGVTVFPWLTANGGTRFLIPPLIFVSLLMAIGVDRLGRRRGAALGLALALFHGVTSWPWAIRAYHPIVHFWRIDDLPWRVLRGRESREDYISHRVDSYQATLALARLAPEGSRVLALEGLPEAHFPGELVVGHQGGINSDLARELIAVIEPDFHPVRITRLRWPAPTATTGVRLEQTNSHNNSWWEIAEMRFVRDGSYVDEGAGRTAFADLFPFTAERIADGDPLTVWRSWQPIRPGVVEVLLDRPVEADSLELRIPQGQHFPEYRISLRDADGRWTTVEAEAEGGRTEVDPRDLQRAARRALAAAGIEYLVTNVEDGGHNIVARPIDEDPEHWGLREIWRDERRRIYAVEPPAAER